MLVFAAAGVPGSDAPVAGIRAAGVPDGGLPPAGRPRFRACGGWRSQRALAGALSVSGATQEFVGLRQQVPVTRTPTLARQPGLQPGSRLFQRPRFARRAPGVAVPAGGRVSARCRSIQLPRRYCDAAPDNRRIAPGSPTRRGDTPQRSRSKGRRDPRCDSSDEPEHCSHRDSLLTAIIMQSVLSQPADNTSPTADKSREKPDKTHSETVRRVRSPQLNNK